MSPNIMIASYILEHPTAPKASEALLQAILRMNHEELKALSNYLKCGSYLS